LTKDPKRARDIIRGIDKKLPQIDPNEHERLMQDLQKEAEIKEKLRKNDEKS
jgi:hypothetical protein